MSSQEKRYETYLTFDNGKEVKVRFICDQNDSIIAFSINFPYPYVNSNPPFKQICHDVITNTTHLFIEK